MKNILRAVLLTTVVSCGGYSSGGSSYNPNTPQQEQSQEGTYRTVANAVNPNITSSSDATQIIIQGDQFEAQIFGSGPDTTHGQFIQSGTRCPTSSDDTNGDGVIDAVEGSSVYGPEILALDSDLAGGGGSFPSGTTYSYSQSDSFSAVLANSNITGLNLEGKVVTIRGIPETATLPQSAQGVKADFPIACGVLQKVSGIE